MYSVEERENSLNRLVNYLSNINSVKAVVLVGSLAGNESDKYSDIDFSIIVDDESVEMVYNDFCNKLDNNNDIFRYFRQIYGENNCLAGIFLKNGLEIDVGFVTEDNFLKKCESKTIPKYKVMYSRNDFSLNVIQKETKDDYKELLKQANLDIWYNLKNAIYGLKRNRLYRVVKELDDMRNQILEIIAVREGVEFRHFKEIDKLSDNIKNKLSETYFKEVSDRELKRSLISLLDLFVCILHEDNMHKEADEYGNMFKNLINEAQDDLANERMKNSNNKR